ncbi:MAG: PAS domain S-box protein [Sedimentisphaerales bacterium]|nr:PAS domain S-box protein [Sedimentisphaerales bacterium]
MFIKSYLQPETWSRCQVEYFERCFIEYQPLESGDMRDSDVKNVRDVKGTHTRRAKLETVKLNISEDKQRENVTLHKDNEGENAWKNIINALSEWIFLSDTEGCILRTNQACEKYTKIPYDKIIGKSCCKIIHGSTKPLPDCAMQQMLRTGRRANSEIHLPDGRWITISVEPVKDKDGKIVNAIHFIRDITQQKTTAETLKDSEQKFKSIFENANDAISYLDFSGKILDINKKGVELHGGRKKDIVNKHFTKLGVLSFKDIPKYIRLFKNILLGDEPTLTVQINKKNGETKSLECSISIIKTDTISPKIMVVARDITNRKHTENILRKNEQMLRSIIDHSIEMFYIHDTDHQLTYVSPQCMTIFGYTPEEMMVNWTTLVTDNRINVKGFELTEKAIKTGRKQKPYLLEIKRKDGNLKIVEIDESPLKDNKGKVTAVTGALRDITESKHVEDALQKSEEKFRDLAEQSPNMIFINKKGKVVYANKRSSEIMGYERDEFYSNDFNFLNLIAPESIEKIKSAFNRHLNEQEVEPYEYTLVTKDGKRIEAIITTKMIEYEGAKSILGIVTDITERKKAEDELRDHEARYRGLFDNASDAIFLMDFDKFIECNNKTLEIYNCTSEQIIGKTPYEYFSPEFQPDGRKSREKALEKINLAQSGQHQFFEWRHLKYDGTPFDAEIYLNPIELAGKIYIQAVVRDITSRKKAEENILRYQEQLKSLASQLTLTEEKERYRIATELHDHISQYLAVSRIKLDEILHSSSSAEERKIIKQINQWLNHAMEESRTLTFDLSSPILHELGFERAVAAWLEDEIQRKHKIETEFLSDQLPKPLDDDICVLLFRNVREILFNIIKHAHAGKVKVSVITVNGNIQVKVEDDGVGFDPAEVAATAAIKSKFGLFSIRERLEHFGGHMEIDSSPGKGCRITLLAPLKKDD